MHTFLLSFITYSIHPTLVIAMAKIHFFPRRIMNFTTK